jgi:hypothetical protein
MVVDNLLAVAQLLRNPRYANGLAGGCQ